MRKYDKAIDQQTEIVQALNDTGVQGQIGRYLSDLFQHTDAGLVDHPPEDIQRQWARLAEPKNAEHVSQWIQMHIAPATTIYVTDEMAQRWRKVTEGIRTRISIERHELLTDAGFVYFETPVDMRDDRAEGTVPISAMSWFTSTNVIGANTMEAFGNPGLTVQFWMDKRRAGYWTYARNSIREEVRQELTNEFIRKWEHDRGWTSDQWEKHVHVITALAMRSPDEADAAIAKLDEYTRDKISGDTTVTIAEMRDEIDRVGEARLKANREDRTLPNFILDTYVFIPFGVAWPKGWQVEKLLDHDPRITEEIAVETLIESTPAVRDLWAFLRLLADKKGRMAGVPAHRSTRRRAERHLPKGGETNVLYLRREVDRDPDLREAVADVTIAPRRHLVRAHWKQVWVGSGDERHKEWRRVASYERGEGPLIETDNVYALTR